MGTSWAGNRSKKLSFRCVISYSMQQWTISWSNCDMWQKVDFMGKPATTSSVVGPRRSSKALPELNLRQWKGHGHCLVVCCLCDPLQVSEFQWNCYIWEVCSAHQWDALKTAMPAASTDLQKEPSSSLRQCLTSRCTANTSEVDWIGLWSFASSAIFTCALANWLPLLQASQQHFVGKMLL